MHDMIEDIMTGELSSSQSTSNIINRHLCVHYRPVVVTGTNTSDDDDDVVTKTIFFASHNLHILEDILYQTFHIPRTQCLMFSLSSSSSKEDSATTSTLIYPVTALHLYDEHITTMMTSNSTKGPTTTSTTTTTTLSCELELITFPLLSQSNVKIDSAFSCESTRTGTAPPNANANHMTSLEPVTKVFSPPAVLEKVVDQNRKKNLVTSNSMPGSTSGRATKEVRSKIASAIQDDRQALGSQPIDTTIPGANISSSSMEIDKRKHNRGLEHRNSYL
jgi:hypothetical protein